MRLNGLLKLILFILIFLVWPLNLYFHNTLPNFQLYLLPAVFIIFSIVIYNKGHKNLAFLSLIFIPFISSKLLLLPLFFLLFIIILEKKKYIFFIILTVILAILFWHNFAAQTVFQTDYEKYQEVIRNTQLYNSPLLARTFHNKFRVMTDKFTENLFALSDPNNYFFGFHPREISLRNQNLLKFPFLSIAFFIFALLNFRQLPQNKQLFALFLAGVLSLSLLIDYDRTDFILWPIVGTIVFSGMTIFQKKYPKIFIYFYPIFIIFSSLDLLKIFIEGRI
jgi:hypothetical protein